MRFSHSSEIWRDHPDLVPGVLFARGVNWDAPVDGAIARYCKLAEARLGAAGAESELPEIQAWRRAFSRMGLKPTQYRCASEALLRRFRKEKSLPRIHPLIDLCNSLSLAFAVPIAVFDVAKVADFIEVRHAAGSETYAAFSGGERASRAARGDLRRCDGQRACAALTNRQSALSAVRPETRAVLIVAEAVHATARADIGRLTTALVAELGAACAGVPASAILSRDSPAFEFGAS